MRQYIAYVLENLLWQNFAGPPRHAETRRWYEFVFAGRADSSEDGEKENCCVRRIMGFF